MSEVISGIKLIVHNSGGVNLPDDPTLPFKFEASFRPPSFMSVAFIGLYGPSEEIVVRAENKEALDKFIEMNNFRTHPRLRRFTITSPDGTVEQFEKNSQSPCF